MPTFTTSAVQQQTKQRNNSTVVQDNTILIHTETVLRMMRQVETEMHHLIKARTQAKLSTRKETNLNRELHDLIKVLSNS